MQSSSMPALPSDMASGTTSTLQLKAPRFRDKFWKGFGQLVVEPSSVADHHTSGPQPAVSIPSQRVEDLATSFTPSSGAALSPASSPTQAIRSLPITASNSRAIKIPYIRHTTYVFPDASTGISQAHQDRFAVLRDIFQRNVEGSPKLCDFATHISYELRMCGSCLADAIPSILVFCPVQKLKKLKSLLTQPHIRSQFEPECATPTSVHFGLLFWAQTIDLLAFHKVAVVLPDPESSEGTVAKAVIGRLPWALQLLNGGNGEQHAATMGCVIQVDGRQLGLTTAHVFRHPWRCAPEECQTDVTDSDTDDDEYDLSEGNMDDVQMAMGAQPWPPLIDNGKLVQLENCQIHIPLPEDYWPRLKEHADLDWALLELGKSEGRLPNTTRILPIMEDLPQHRTEVLIITARSLEIPAILYNIPSYIGGAKGSRAAEVWTVGLSSEEHPILKGDSGSIVVDALSRKLYGIVVAANPFGDVHLSPFVAILAQVKTFFATDNVCVTELPHDLDSRTLEPEIEANYPAENQIMPLGTLTSSEDFGQSFRFQRYHWTEAPLDSVIDNTPRESGGNSKKLENDITKIRGGAAHVNISDMTFEDFVRAEPSMKPVAPSSEPSAKKLDRVYKPRTKKGCLTCRKRRIKCDETRPVCSNCARSKRECLGYPEPPKSMRPTDQQILSLPPKPPASQIDPAIRARNYTSFGRN